MPCVGTPPAHGLVHVHIHQPSYFLCLQNWMMSMSALVQVATITGSLVQVACYQQCSSTVWLLALVRDPKLWLLSTPH